MKPSYVRAIIVPTISISLSILILLATLLIYWNFRKDLSQTINLALIEDESILLTIDNQPEFQMKDLYLSYTLKGMSFIFFNDNSEQIHPKKAIDNDLLKLLQLNSDDKRFYILNKLESRHTLIIVNRIKVSNKNMTIIAQKDLSSLYTDLYESIFIGLLLLLMGGLTLGFLLYKVSLRLTVPLQKLMLSTELISSGNYNERVMLGGLKEIDEVGLAFNKMALDIEEKIDALQIEIEKKELFISGFTHELKTPLTNIIGYSDYILRRDISPEDIKSFLDIINREGKRLNALGVYLRDYILQDQTQIELKSLTLETISKDIRIISHRMLADLEVGLNIIHKEGYALINTELYLTCCMNILHNAAKASKPNNTIDVYLDNDKNMFKTVFLDRGSGIPSNEISKIIKPFYQGDTLRGTHNKETKGFGLGLFIVDRIIRDGFKGYLTIESIPKEYTKVTVLIPLK